MNIRQQIQQAHTDQTLVHIFRDAFDDFTDGYVVAVGAEWFAYELVDDKVTYDGFRCCRFEDVTEVEAPSERRVFLERALQLRGVDRQANPSLDASSVAALLQSASKVFPLLTVHLEDVDSDVCYIGKVQKIDDAGVELLHITPDAEWESQAERYELADITRIDLGGAYEQALVLVAESRS